MKDWQRIEAVLFGSGKYLTEEQIAQLSGVSKKALKKSLDELKKHYSHIDSSLDIFKEGDSWKLNVKEEYSHIVKNVISEAEMSKPLMETLALIAYKSPVFQSEIIDMKGAGAYEYISLLEEKGFITKEKSGRTFKIKTTPKFYDYFDISGDSKLRQMFKNVKKPESLGTLEVYNQEKQEEEELKKDMQFSDKILERMKKVETTSSDHEEKKKFLDNFDDKFSKAKSAIDETDKEMNEFRKVVPSQTEQEAQQEDGEPESDEDEKPKRTNNDPDKKDMPEKDELIDEVDGEESADDNYPDKILKKFERALDKLDSSKQEKEKGEEIADEEDAEDDDTDNEDSNENSIPKEVTAPVNVKKEKTDSTFLPEKTKINKKETEKSRTPKKENSRIKKEKKAAHIKQGKEKSKRKK